MNELSIIWKEYTGASTNLAVRVPFAPDGFINATEMAKVFEETPEHWLRSKRASEYISAVAEVYLGEKMGNVEKVYSTLVIVRRGTQGEQGTWLHPKLAIEFARWLNPRFAVWCDIQIMEILRMGRANSTDLATEVGGTAWTERYESHDVQRGSSVRLAKKIWNKGELINNRRRTVKAATGVEPSVFHGMAKAEGMTGDATKSSLEYMRRKGLPHAPAIALANDVMAKTGNDRAAMRNLTSWIAAFDKIHAGLLDCGVDIAEFCAASEEDVAAAMKELNEMRDSDQLSLFADLAGK